MAGMRMLECIFDFDPEIEDEVRSHFATDLMSVPSSNFFLFFLPSLFEADFYTISQCHENTHFKVDAFSSASHFRISFDL